MTRVVNHGLLVVGSVVVLLFAIASTARAEIGGLTHTGAWYVDGPAAQDSSPSAVQASTSRMGGMVLLADSTSTGKSRSSDATEKTSGNPTNPNPEVKGCGNPGNEDCPPKKCPPANGNPNPNCRKHKSGDGNP